VKKRFFLLFILILAIASGCRNDEPFDKNEIDEGFPADKDHEFDSGSAILFPELNEQLIADLELLGKIWGFLKYHHPEVGKGNYHWDYELFRFLPKYLQVKDLGERDKVITDWINQYGEIPVCTTCKETPPDAYIKPDFSWVENSNMNNVLKDKIRKIYQNRHQGKHYYIQIRIGHPEFLNERFYSGMVFPDAGYRLLTLYRFWNMIQYYSPYKYLTDNKWDNILQKYIPLFVLAENRLEYELATLQTISELPDTHAVLLNGFSSIEASRGNKYAPFRVWFIEGKLVVTDYYNPELKEISGPEIGDIITHINGETVESIVENLKKYYPASNDAARLPYISFDLLRSNNNTININYISSGQAKQKNLHLTMPYNRYGLYKVNSNEKCYKLLDGNIGYITLASIRGEDFSVIQSSFLNTKGIIIDIRNYPSLFSSYFYSYFVTKPTPYARQTKANSDNPGEFTFTNIGTTPYVDGVDSYQGKLMVLVNEITLSQAELIAMTFRAGVNTKIIGSANLNAAHSHILTGRSNCFRCQIHFENGSYATG